MAGEQKTEQATPRRRQKAREQGQVVRSRELMGSLAVMTTIMVLAAQATMLPGYWRGILRHDLSIAALSGDLDTGPRLLAGAGYAVLRAASLAAGLSWIVALVSAIAQGGLVFSPAALQPNLAHFNPVERVKQLFSLSALSRLLKSLLPGAAIVWIASAILVRDWGKLPGASRMRAQALMAFAAARVFEVAWKAALVLLVWSGADYFLERQRMAGQLKMSKQELRDEHKETEGNPAIKGRIRRLRRQTHRKRMLEQVKRATVVITNPDEFAIAIEYRPAMNAPVVVAKGRNLFAQQIKRVALWQGIPLVENLPLAHALYRAVEVGQAIPPKLYAVVAAILAAIYRAQERAQKSVQNAPAGKVG